MSVRSARAVAPRFDPHRCKRCGLCAAVCPEEAIELPVRSTATLARPEACSGCRTCELICPDFAVFVAGAPDDRPLARAANRATDAAGAGG